MNSDDLTAEAKVLGEMPTLAQGQCCNLKVETPTTRVWLCRVGGGITIELCKNGRWTRITGGCIPQQQVSGRISKG